ncbi:O-antigen ligase family protein [uncultured Alteromonas sp.]|mgnify:CR=1 FL=1|uniref:O-antigen ligase family protein n=1 Tax=uncultured Alteromonas sp. TaxID=179113 RepID=UPI0030CD8963|tara:strand:+ start:9843 stop:11192 length:1350 start_codon:yes stop_codon:yes gene_type:complete
MISELKNNKNSSSQPNMSSAPFGFFLLCIYTALVLIRPHEWPIFDIQFPILRIILVLTFFTYLITLRPKAWNTQCTLLILLFLSMLLSEARAFRFFSDLGPVIDWINSNIIPFIVYLGFLTTLKRQKTILIISILSCVVFTLHSYVQVTSLLGEGWAETVITRYDGPEPIIQARYIGIFNDPNDMGMFLVMNIPIVLFFMFSTTSSMKKLFWGGIIVWMLLGIYWTGSRGSLVGLLAVMAAIFYFKYGKVKSIIVGLISLPMITIGLSSFRTIGKDDQSSLDRLTAWYQGIQMFKHRPLFGFGKERFLEYHSKVAHNSYVTVMAELGVFGYLLWMSFLLITFLLLVKIVRLKKPNDLTNSVICNEEIVLAKYLFISLIGYCSTAFFISRSYIMFFYMFAAMAAASYIRIGQYEPEKIKALSGSDIGKVFILSAISLILLYVLITVLLNL